MKKQGELAWHIETFVGRGSCHKIKKRCLDEIILIKIKSRDKKIKRSLYGETKIKRSLERRKIKGRDKKINRSLDRRAKKSIE